MHVYHNSTWISISQVLLLGREDLTVSNVANKNRRRNHHHRQLLEQSDFQYTAQTLA
jgi:hypothetical protein